MDIYWKPRPGAGFFAGCIFFMAELPLPFFTSGNLILGLIGHAGLSALTGRYSFSYRRILSSECNPAYILSTSMKLILHSVCPVC